MTAKPKTRKAPAKTAAPKSAPKEMEPDADMPPQSPLHAIVEAEDILATANKLADAVYLIALELDEYKCGAICAVADAIRDKITVSLDLLDSYMEPHKEAFQLEARAYIEKTGGYLWQRGGPEQAKPKAEPA